MYKSEWLIKMSEKNSIDKVLFFSSTFTYKFVVFKIFKNCYTAGSGVQKSLYERSKMRNF